MCTSLGNLYLIKTQNISSLVSSSGRDGSGSSSETLQIDQRAWIEFPLAVQEQGKYKQWHSLVPLVPGSFLSFGRALTVPVFSMWSLWLVLQNLLSWFSVVS